MSDKKEKTSFSSGEQKESKAQMMGIKAGVFFMIGNIVGSGIFMSSDRINEKISNKLGILGVWLCGGIISLIGAFCYIELGTMFPENGGEGVYLREAYGKGFSAIYYYVCALLTLPGGNAVVGQAAFRFILKEILEKRLKEGKKISFDFFTSIISSFFICFLSWINIQFPKGATIFSNIAFFFKVGALLLILFVGGFRLCFENSNDQNYERVKQSTTTEDSLFLKKTFNIGYVIIASLWSYEGWNSLNYVGGLVKNPKRSFPIILIISLVIITILYLLINLIYLFLVPTFPSLSTENEFISSVYVIEPYFPVFFSHYIFPMIIGFALLGGLNGCFMCGAYVTQGAAIDHLLPSFFSTTTKLGIPIWSVLLQGILTIFFTFVPLDFLFSIVNLSIWGCYVLTTISIFFLRKRKDLIRPFTIWWPIPIIFSLVGIFLCISGFLSMIIYQKESPFWKN